MIMEETKLNPKDFQAVMQTVVNDTLCEVLENFAFMFGEGCSKKKLPEGASQYLRAEIGFKGEVCGKIAMGVSANMCPELAANILGLDADDDLAAERAGDALKEVLNIICGQVLTTVAGDEPIFDLTVPEIQSLDAAGWQEFMDCPDTYAFRVDDYPVLLKIIF